MEVRRSWRCRDSGVENRYQSLVSTSTRVYVGSSVVVFVSVGLLVVALVYVVVSSVVVSVVVSVSVVLFLLCQLVSIVSSNRCGQTSSSISLVSPVRFCH